MYINLINAMKTKGISNNAAAATINMPEPTFRSKMRNIIQVIGIAIAVDYMVELRLTKRSKSSEMFSTTRNCWR